ncbi:hypothetical protein [Streptomyces sp. enrichment culture]|uniref:hypothetical protein n=1 Tax=Streptomyces sp. enrichment culture TaxID=1795815 RepID=UPI003F546311
MDRIIAEAQVTRTTFYRHLRSTEDLVLAHVERCDQDVRGTVTEAFRANADPKTPTDDDDGENRRGDPRRRLSRLPVRQRGHRIRRAGAPRAAGRARAPRVVPPDFDDPAAVRDHLMRAARAVISC